MSKPSELSIDKLIEYINTSTWPDNAKIAYEALEQKLREVQKENEILSKNFVSLTEYQNLEQQLAAAEAARDRAIEIAKSIPDIEVKLAAACKDTDRCCAIAGRRLEKIVELEAENKRLRSALEHYAASEYEGTIAREALK